MNQEKIGKFIAETRKNKKMTQKELAERLGVSDRTVGNWENGRNMPDLSLFKPLCIELEISINDLISGENIKEKEYQEKFEENVLNTINYSNKKINKTKIKIFILLGCIGIFILIFVSIFLIDVNRMNDNKPVIFSTWGFNYAPPIDLNPEYINISITEYIENIDFKYDKGKTFSSIKTYLIEEKNKSLYYVYSWVLSESYYLENNEIKLDTSSSMPYKFEIKRENNRYEVIDSRVPRDGNLYEKDMKVIFPSSIRKYMNNVYTDGTIERLKIDIQKQVTLYFHQQYKS